MVLTDAASLADADVAAARDLAGAGVPVHLTAADGSLVTTATT